MKNHKNTYAKTFEVMLEVLLFITYSGRAVTWRDVCEHVIEKDRQTLNRYLRALAEQGYLIKHEGAGNKINSYTASEKANELFGVKA